MNVETSDVPGAPDQVDLNVNVVEKPTGSLQLGAGFSSAEKLALSFSIKQENAFGTGNYLGVEVNTSKYNRTLVFNSVDPYFTTDGISRTIDVYYRSSKPYEDQGGNYELVTTGAGLRFGVPVQRAGHGVLRRQRRAHRDQARHQHPGRLPGLRRTLRLHQHRAAADRRLGARRPRQRHRAQQRAACSGWPAKWAWPATPATCAATTSTSSTCR